MKSRNTDIVSQNRVLAWIALAMGLVLLIPLIAMQFTSEVNWTPGDFVIAGALLFGTGSLFVLAARRVNRHRAIIGAAFAAALLYVWAELAVGAFTGLGS